MSAIKQRGGRLQLSPRGPPLPPDTDYCLTPTKNALFKRWAFMAGDTKGKGQRPGQRERLSWSVGSRGPAGRRAGGPAGKYCEMDVERCVRSNKPPRLSLGLSMNT